jgi:type IX secretion system PorP/SprF family membrane protein
MKQTILLSVLFLSFLAKIQAQDPRFAQFYAAPIHVNPAMAGVSSGSARMALNYRDLYYSLLGNKPFRTISASYDQRFRAVNRDYFALSGSVMRDQAGLADFHLTQVNVGGSYLKQVNGGRYASNEQYIVAGGQIGFAQQSLNWSDLTFSAQYDASGYFFDPNAPTNEAFDGKSSNLYLDFNAGLLWYAVWDDNKSLYLGGAMHHINTPSASFTGDDKVRVFRRYSANGGGELPLTKQLSLMPAFLVMSQGPMLSVTTGANIRYTNREWKELALRTGLWTHVNNRANRGVGLDAVIVAAIFELEKWNLGFSYDITSSGLSASNYSRGAFEMSLTYIRPDKSKARLICPKF